MPTAPSSTPPTALPASPCSTPPTALPTEPATPLSSPPTPSAWVCAPTAACPASFRLRSATTSWPSGPCMRTLPATPASKAAVIARSSVSPGSSSLAGKATVAVAAARPWPSMRWPASASCDSAWPRASTATAGSPAADVGETRAAAFALASSDATSEPAAATLAVAFAAALTPGEDAASGATCAASEASTRAALFPATPRPRWALTSAASAGTGTCCGAVVAASFTCTLAGSTSRTIGSEVVFSCSPTRAPASIAGLTCACRAAVASATSASTFTGIVCVYLAASACRSRSD